MLNIPFNYVSENKIKEMSEKSDISQASSLILAGNNLTDFSLAPLLKNPLLDMEQMDLSKNTRLTGKGLAGMANKNYSNLKILDLSETSIGDEGMKYLSEAKFPKLVALLLKDVDITGKGMEYLSNMEFPQL